MKTIIVVSDTHGNYSSIEKLLPIMNESDYVFHLGDFERDITAYKRVLKAQIVSVKGNCDGGGEEKVVEIEGVKILLTHGDVYNVKTTLSNLYYRAKELGATVVFYGHTHNSNVEKIDGIEFINSGCMNKFSQNSYCYAVIHNKKLTSKVVYF